MSVLYKTLRAINTEMMKFMARNSNSPAKKKKKNKTINFIYIELTNKPSFEIQQKWLKLN